MDFYLGFRVYGFGLVDVSMLRIKVLWGLYRSPPSSGHYHRGKIRNNDNTVHLFKAQCKHSSPSARFGIQDLGLTLNHKPLNP